MSKFFRNQKVSSMPNTPKSTPKDVDNFVRYPEDDNLSLVSMGSHMSSISQLSGFSTLDIIDKDELITDTQKETIDKNTIDSITHPEPETIVNVINPIEISMEHDNTIESTDLKEIFIGTVYDQNLIYYTSRLVTSKFLLAGKKHQLIPDNIVRVSIKNVSLLVVANCVQLCPEVLYLYMTNTNRSPIESNIFQDDEASQSDEQSDVLDEAGAVIKDDDDELLLNMKDDHFGKNPNSYYDFMSPLSKSIDTVLESELKKSKLVTKTERANKTDKLNKQLSDIWSKSEIIEIKRYDTPAPMVPESSSPRLAVENDQQMQDVLFYYNHSDPILRGNVQNIVGMVFNAIFKNFERFEEFHRIYYRSDFTNFLQPQLLLAMLMKVSEILFYKFHRCYHLINSTNVFYI